MVGAGEKVGEGLFGVPKGLATSRQRSAGRLGGCGRPAGGRAPLRKTFGSPLNWEAPWAGGSICPGCLDSPCGGRGWIDTLRRAIIWADCVVSHAPRISPRARLLAAFAAVVVAAPMAIAAWLTPDSRGWGTHEQLGCPPCWLQRATGRRCPSCGMTTAWAHAARGDVPAALESSVGGTLLFAAAASIVVGLVIAAMTGRSPVKRTSPKVVLWIATGWVVVTVLDWVRRLAAG